MGAWYQYAVQDLIFHDTFAKFMIVVTDWKAGD